MTNEIVSAVLKVSDGKATFEPLRFHEGKYGEMKFWWATTSAQITSPQLPRSEARSGRTGRFDPPPLKMV